MDLKSIIVDLTNKTWLQDYTAFSFLIFCSVR